MQKIKVFFFIKNDKLRSYKNKMCNGVNMYTYKYYLFHIIQYYGFHEMDNLEA